MQTITVTISREQVTEEVAKASDYAGSKLLEAGDATGRDRLLATDDDLADFDRFLREAQAQICREFRAILLPQSCENPGLCSLRFRVSKYFNPDLQESVQTALRSFCVCYVLNCWYGFSSKDLAAEHAARASEWLLQAEGLLYSCSRPRKPIPAKN